MFKKILLPLVLILGCLTMVSAQHDKALMWRISGNGLNKVSYLYGTMHVRDARVFNFNDTIIKALHTVDYIASEVNLNSMATDIFERLFKKDSTINLQDVLSVNEYNELNLKVQSNLNVSLSEINPNELWLLELFLGNGFHYTGYRTFEKEEEQKEVFLDAYLYNVAQNLGRKPAGLETLDEYKILSGNLPPKVAARKFLDTHHEGNDSIDKYSYEYSTEKLMKLYQNQHIDSMYQFVMQNHHSKVLLKELDRRNVNMVNRLDSLLRKGSALACVGAAHLAGDSGMINLLRLRGYTLTPVKATFNTKFKLPSPKLKFNWQPLVIEDSLFSVNMPDKSFKAPLNHELPFEMNLHMVYDIFTNYNFMLINLQFGFDLSKGESEEVILKKFADGMKNQMRNTELLSAEVKKNHKAELGQPSITFELILKQRKTYIRYSLSTIGGIVNCLTVTGSKKQVMSEHSEYFFKSLKYNLKKIKELREFALYTDSKLSYKVRSPKFLKLKSEGSEAFDSKGELLFKTHRLPIDGNTYSHGILKYKKGYYLDNLKDFFESNINYFTSTRNAVLISDTTYWLNGLPCSEFVLKNSQANYQLKARVIVKNNRPYYLVVTGNDSSLVNKDAQAFFDSFELLPFQENRYQEFTSSDKSFKIKAPGILLNQSDDDPIDEAQLDKDRHLVAQLYDYNSYVVTSAQTSDVFFISAGKIGRYHEPAKDGNTVDRLFFNGIGVNNKILDSDEINVKDTYVRNITSRSESDSTLYIKYRYVVAKGYVYELAAYTRFPQNLTKPSFTAFFNSFKPLGDPLYKPVSDVPKLVLQDIDHVDSVKSAAAFNVLYSVVFKPKHLSDLRKFVATEHHLHFNPFESVEQLDEIAENSEISSDAAVVDTSALINDTEEAISDSVTQLSKQIVPVKPLTSEEKNAEVKRVLMWTLLSSEIESKYTFFSEVYRKKLYKEQFQTELLALLTEFGDSASLVTFKDLILQHPPQKYAYYQLINSDEPLVVKHIYPEILKMITSDSVDWLISNTVTLLNDETIGVDDLGQYKDAFTQKLANKINYIIHLRDSLDKAEPSTESIDDIAYRFGINNWIEVIDFYKTLKVLDTSKAKLIAKQFIEQSNIDWKYAGIIELIKNDQLVAEQQLILLLDNPYYRSQLFYELNDLQLKKYLPKGYLNNEIIAENFTFNHLMKSGVSYDMEIKFLAKDVLKYEGTKRMVYLFKFRIPGVDHWYVAATGFYDKKLFSFNTEHLTALTKFEVIESQSIHEHFKILKAALVEGEVQESMPEYLNE